MHLPELSIDRGLSNRQQLIRIVGNRLFLALTIALVLAIAWVIAVYGKPNVGALPAVLFVGVVGGLIGLQNRLVTLTDADLLLLAKSTTYLLLAPLVGGFLAVLLFVLFISGLLQGDIFPKFSPDAVTTEVVKVDSNRSTRAAGAETVETAIESGAVLSAETDSVGADGPISMNSNGTVADKEAAESDQKSHGIERIFKIHGDGPEDYAKLIFWCFLAGFSERFVTNIMSRFENTAAKSAGDEQK